ncbi:helix-turn-helix domain-containing protein [Edwardsiella tarda]|uniref:helix-turn-helix domain-containing protein n=1 Tax=Edwardsiella tarda TaxID=636 RepID=UPI00068222C9|nr:helix-turn-helix transcriptional regulator [Edwardsiella tarda]
MSDTYNKIDEKEAKKTNRFFLEEEINRFGKRLEEAMAGESKVSFAKKCGISDTVIGKYLRGESYPSINKLPAIANACGKSMNWLIIGSNDAHEEVNKADIKLSVQTEDELTNWWLMIFKSLTESERKKAINLFQRHGISALLPDIMDENATASVESQEILRRRNSTESNSLASKVSTRGKKAG